LTENGGKIILQRYNENIVPKMLDVQFLSWSLSRERLFGDFSRVRHFQDLWEKC